MLVDIGAHSAFYLETDHILHIHDNGGRPGCYISMTGGKGVSSDQSAREIMRKIEAAKQSKAVAP